ncbi:MAG: isoprenyl transferase [Candidatus Omnitrophica bacterium]|nr:isoprenyl transferase [Candidatus Omnitrophota bacterium]
MNTSKNIPQHIAVIMDGNGRWAARRGLSRIEGHRAGIKAARETMQAASDLGVKVLTLYTFSTENWKRPKTEVSALFKLLEHYLASEGDKLLKNNIRFQVIGRLRELPDSLRIKLEAEIEKTKNNTGLILNLALNYGGRPEIIDAVRDIVKDVREGKIDPGGLDEKLFADYLYTRRLPDPDLLIRTSGEFRVSNFLLWQIAYSEICVVEKLWPDFKKEDFEKCVHDYQARERRFGG